MKRTHKAYINIELGTATWNVDLEGNAEQDILDEGIDCTECEVYELIYEGHMLEEDKLKELLDNKSKSMLYPLDCFDSLSYEGWLEYKKEAEAEDKYREEQRLKQMQK